MPSIPLSGPVLESVLASEPDYSTLKGKSVLITGAAQGLGAKLAEGAAAAGAHVTVADINEVRGREFCDSLRSKGHAVDFVKCDVTKWKDQVGAFKVAVKSSPSGHLNHVIANAGVMDKPFFVGNEEPIQDLEYDPPEPDVAPIEVNLRGATYTLKLAQLYLMMATPSPAAPGSQSLLFILSPESYLTLPCSIVYGGAKFGARGLFRSSRQPLASKGVRVNALVPWLMDTPMNAGSAGLMEILNSVGCHAMNLDSHVHAALHLMSNSEIVGRAVAVMQGDAGIKDVEDDEEGGDGTKYRGYGYQGWPDAKIAYAKLYGMLGFEVDPSNAAN
ncbi:NAD(P)-binding protein [Thozetella sp. PMI_491]|nr:NAD(P)-binding protein [Thozetella sp. PMI_491]